MVGLPGGSVDGTRRDGKLTHTGSVGHLGFHLEVASSPLCIPPVNDSALLSASPIQVLDGYARGCLRGCQCERVRACVLCGDKSVHVHVCV